MSDTKEQLLSDLANAGVELAEYASYAEIVGEVRVNRNVIRTWCDKIFDLKKQLAKLEDDESE